MGPQLLPWHSQCQGSARAQAPNGEVRGGYPADCIAPASPGHNTKVKVWWRGTRGELAGDAEAELGGPELNEFGQELGDIDWPRVGGAGDKCGGRHPGRSDERR